MADAGGYGTAPSSAADKKFAALSKRWLDGSLRLNPINATAAGEHRYDHEVDDVSPAGRKARSDFNRAVLAELDAMDRTKLSRANQVDAALLSNEIRYEQWDDEVQQSWAWDPQGYNGLAGSAVYLLMARDFAPLPVRLKAAISRMEKLPRLFAQTRDALQPARVPKIHAQTVARQNKGLISIIDGLMPQTKVLSPADRKRLTAAADRLRQAVNAHQFWLDNILVPNAKGDFRIGAKLYDEKLAFALNSPLSRAEIRKRAEAAFADTRAQMYAIAKGVLAGKAGSPPTPDAPSDAEQQAAIAAALELAYVQHPKPEEFVSACEEAVKTTTAFVKTKDLITLPDAPVKVIVTPEFKRGVAGAYCDPPGPLEKGQDTFFAVDPIPAEWTAKQSESYLREYNSRAIHELTVHEAMPGHYVQLWHSNRYPSVLRAVLSSGSFVEGWACYAEDVMAEQGYLDRDPLYLLAHLKLNLRSILNSILDQAIHVDGMEREDAMKLMTGKAFQQESEAAGKWVRAQVTSCQLPTYFVGLSEHHELRKEVEAREGTAFNLKAYHDKVLSYGSPPVRYARALMLNEPID
ncbi:MAG: DUF885 domain-containing protein [Proteobacteria bacterium]|nr:DUF885 domain-containing protein [Pseudomonadota bacterium]